MCWTTYIKPECKIARENIDIFKICKFVNSQNTVKSIYKDYLYKLGEPAKKIDTMHCQFGFPVHYTINEGYHSYNPKKVEISTDIINYIVHSYNYYLDVFNLLDFDIIKVDGFIPKYTKYYENEHGEIVSEQIVLTNFKRL